MDPAHATEAIWIDPLSYNYLKDGPPYLPGLVGGKVASQAKAEVRAWVRQAAVEIGDDVGIAFQHCVAEYGGAPMAEIAVLLSCVRAEAMIHQAHHWQTRGSTYYGDHLLFERVYGEVNGFIDGLAERAVGSGHHILVQPLMQISHMVAFSKLFYSDAPVSPEPEEMPLLSLRALLKSILLLQLVYESLQAKGALSNGTDNLLQDIADKQEGLLYLLKQRTKTRNATMSPKSALDEFKHALMTRRVASRFIKAMEHDSPEAMKQYLKDHPNADKSKHTVKKTDEKGGEDKGGEVKVERSRELSNALYDMSGGGGALNDVARAVEHGEPVSKKKIQDSIKGLEQYLDLPEGTKIPGPHPRKVDHKKIQQAVDSLKKMLSSGGGESGGSKSVKPKASREKSSVLYDLSGGGGSLNDVARALERGESVSVEKIDSALKGVTQHFDLPEGTKIPGPGGGRKNDHKKLHKAVRTLLSMKYGLEDDDGKEVKDFIKRKPPKGKELTDQQLMQKFLREASPETKERMKGMSVGDFKAMYAAIMDEES